MKTFNNDIEKLRKVRELLITVDMVNGFVKEGPLAAPSIMRIVPRQIELLEEASNDKNTGLIFIRDSHSEDATEFKTYPAHCIRGTYETEIIDELKKYEKYGVSYFKNSTNFMFAPGIQQDLLKLYNLEKVRLLDAYQENVY